MHRESITDALLGTVLAFNTVLEIPAGTSLLVQIFGAGVIFLVLYNMLEQARKWEEKIKKPAGRQPGWAKHKKYIHCHSKAER